VGVGVLVGVGVGVGVFVGVGVGETVGTGEQGLLLVLKLTVLEVRGPIPEAVKTALLRTVHSVPAE
jgi:hypothetical protein